MASGGWITLASAVVAAVALVVSGFAYRLQHESQGRTDEDQLNDLIEKIQQGLASLASLNQPQGAFAFEATASGNATTLTGLQGHAIEAKKLIEQSGIEPDWFQCMILAYAFTQAWDYAGALYYWERAVEVSNPEHQAHLHKPQHQAHIRSLLARAEFYYNRGRKGGQKDDWQLARDDYDAALRELLKDPDGQGPDLAAQQATSIRVSQAGFELNTGDDAFAIGFIADAFVYAKSIVVPWRRMIALQYTDGFVGMLQRKVLPPRDLFTPVAAELSRRKVKIEEFPVGASR
jgi:hypothetical protein